MHGYDLGLGRERQPPALRHRVAGVGGKIDQRRLKLPLVRKQRWNIGRNADLHIDGGAERVDEDFVQAAQQLSDIDRLGAQVAAAAECEQAARDRRAPFDRVHRQPRETADPSFVSCAALDQRGRTSTPCSTLLKSCAMPPASWPSACMRSA